MDSIAGISNLTDALSMVRQYKYVQYQHLLSDIASVRSGIIVLGLMHKCIQCFDAVGVGWAAEGASGL